MSAQSGRDLIERYLAAYKAHDLQAMGACQDPEFTFSDPAFPNLDTKHSKGMFAMFINGREINKMEIEYEDIKKGENDLTYTAKYTVHYIFAGRPVVNPIYPTFTISPKTSLILRQVDDFAFYPWARQALGVSGWLLGWSGYLQGKVQQTAGDRLKKVVEKADAKL